jgi:hypothetical protein
MLGLAEGDHSMSPETLADDVTVIELDARRERETAWLAACICGEGTCP